jgi:hypothetical protein
MFFLTRREFIAKLVKSDVQELWFFSIKSEVTKCKLGASLIEDV